MTVRKLIRLNFGRSPTHFGEVGIGLEQTSERVRSDTLFSAWVSTYARIFGGDGITTLLQHFPNDTDPPGTEPPPFRVSSTFIYRRNDQDFIDYLPKPVEPPVGYPEVDLPIAKTYRKLNYLPLSVWRRWYQGSGLDHENEQELIHYAQVPKERSGRLGQAGTFDYAQAFKPYELPKVSIDRTTRATNFYHTGLVQFAWEPSNGNGTTATIENQAGLYFLLEFPQAKPNLEAELHMALELLGEEGLGGERSSGAGRFEILTWADLPADWQAAVNFDQGNRHSLISLFWDKTVTPAWLGDQARYTLQERGGWISSPSGRQLRRKMVRMFAEGSVFAEVPRGQLADVTPSGFSQHSVYRNGIALSLPVRLKEAAA
jgi:CRISPR-associated protein Csm4